MRDECILPLCRVLGHGLDLDEVPPPPAVKAPTLPSTEVYHPHGRASPPPPPQPPGAAGGALPVKFHHAGEALLRRLIPPHPPADGEFGEPRSQKGLDRYLDSLFDPVLSYGNGVRGGVPLPEAEGIQYFGGADGTASVP